MDSDDYPPPQKKSGKLHNVLPLWGNEQTMNLNPLILANIQSSSYFKVHLFKLKTYHEVVDEIYYQVKHLEPWERGSRKTAGQTGMCGGVRGVGAGGIVSTAYCLLYKLYTLRLTRKQVNGLLTHTDSPYIRALGFMYIRYTQPPSDLYDWYEEYLQDEEEIDVKAGGGQSITIGQMLHQWLVKLDWFSTLFPRIPVPIQKQIESKLAAYSRQHNVNLAARYPSNNANNERESASTYSNVPNKQREQREYFDRGERSERGGGGGERDKERHSYRSTMGDERRGERYRSRSRERNNGRPDHREHRYLDRGGEREYYHQRDRVPAKREKDYYRETESSGRGGGGGGGGGGSGRDPDQYNRREYSNRSSKHYDRDRKYR